MSELKTNLQSILQEKTTKIIPQNIKKDVEVLGVTGSYDKEDIKELQDELADAQNELATVRRDLDNSTATIAGNGEIVTLNGTANARFKKAPLPLGNSTQETVTAVAGTTVSGESINVSGIDLNKVEILNVNGNTKQETTTGKNLFLPALTEQTTSNHVTCTPNGDGTFTLNGTSDASGRFNISSTDDKLYFTLAELGFSEGETGFLNGCPLGGNTSTPTASYKIFMSGLSGASNINDGGSGAIITANSSNMSGKFYMAIDYASGITFNNLVFKPMIVKGITTSTDYEPYTGGKASPNPDYPQDAYSAGANMNLFDKDDSNFNASWDGGDANKLTLLANGNIQTTADYNNWRAKAIDISSLKPNTQYTLSIELISATSTQTNLATIRIPYNNGTSNSYINFNGNDSIYVFTSLAKPVFTFTTPSDMTHVGLSLSSYGASTSAVFGNIKIEEGSKATAYSEYNQGNMNVEISNKNLFGLTANDFINGTTTGEGKRVELYLKPNTNYTLSSNEAEGTDLSTNIWLNGTSSAYNGVGLNRPKTTQTDANGMLYISIRITKINTIFENNWLQLEEGSTATTYVAHAGQSFTIPTQVPFRKIGNYKDTFVKKPDGKWYEKYVIGNIVFDGSEDENWQQDGSDTYITVSDAKGTSAIPVVSNYFTYTENASGNSWGQIRFGLSNNNLIFFGNLTLSDFKTWLSTHNTIVNYVLEAPTYIECTQEQSAILDQINTFYETTNIFSIDEVSPNFTFTYNKVYASPSPDDESPIQTVSGDVEVKVQNKNLAKEVFDQKLSIDGTGQNRTVTSTNKYRAQIIEVKPNTDYVISGDFSVLDDRYMRIGMFDDYPIIGSITTKYVYGASPLTFTTDTNTKYILLYNSATIDTVVSNLQLEQGSTATTYVAHQEQVLPLSLKSKNLVNINEITSTNINPVTLQEFKDFEVGKTYTFSAKLDLGNTEKSGRIRMKIEYNDETPTSYVGSYAAGTGVKTSIATVTITDNIESIALQYQPNQTGIKYYDFQLEERKYFNLIRTML